LLETGQIGAALGAWAGTRVLVLEDEPTVARLIADVLEDEGLRVDVLLDSREALDRTAREDYALVICDMKMPELNGEHFYQALARAKSPFASVSCLSPETFLPRILASFWSAIICPMWQNPFASRSSRRRSAAFSRQPRRAGLHVLRRRRKM